MYFWNKCILIGLGYQTKSINIYWVIAMKGPARPWRVGKESSEHHTLQAQALPRKHSNVPPCKRQTNKKKDPESTEGPCEPFIATLCCSQRSYEYQKWFSFPDGTSEGQRRVFSQGHMVTQRQSWVLYSEWMSPIFGAKLPGTNCWGAKRGPLLQLGLSL